MIENYLKSPNLITFLRSSSNQENFTFIFPNKKYEVPLLLAKFISPRIRKMKLQNPEINLLELDIPNENGIFEDILQIPITKKVKILPENLQAFYEIVLALGNETLFKKITPNFDETITIDNVFYRILFKNIQSLNQSNKTKEIDFLAKNYYNIPAEKMAILPFEDLYSVLISPHLTLLNEDAFFIDIASCYIDKYGEKEFKMLLDLVQPYNLSTDMKELYFKFAKINGISENILNAVRKCFELESMNRSEDLSLNRYFVENKTIAKLQERIEKLKSPTKPVNLEFNKQGLFSYLYQNYQQTKNFPNQFVKITTSSNSLNTPDVVFPFRQLTKYWITAKNDNAPWIQFDLHPHRLKCTGYMLTSHNGPSYLKSWDFLAYDEMTEKWVTLDSIRNTSSLCSTHAKQAFRISNNKEYSTFKFVMKGPSARSDWRFCLSQVDFYGEFIEEIL